MVRLTLLATLFGLLSVGAQPTPLHDGQQVSLRGTLLLRPEGRLQFVALKTAQEYRPLVDGPAAQATRELGLSNYNRYDLLYAHRGQVVTVTGTVLTDDASPYYLHNVSVKVRSIQLPDGTNLVGDAYARPNIAVDTGQYVATVLLPADIAAPWRYTAHGLPDVERQFLSCSSNGGGDVVNCFCGAGFRPISVTALSGSTPLHGEVLDSMAQTEMADDGHRKAVTITIACSR